MIKVNDNFCKLPGSYLFSEVARKVKAYAEANPTAKIIKMGIGDVTRPLCPAAIAAMTEAVKDQASTETFHGYGPETGYDFLRQAIVAGDYAKRGVKVELDEIFVNDGAKSDTGNIGDILSIDCKVAVTDPVYPVYVDTNVMAGRAGDLRGNGCWSNVIYLPCTVDNDFIPALPKETPDVIYLCYPNNPTGTTLTRDQLKVWVDYARKNGALILFDSAYEAYITDEDVPHSIYEIPGAKEVAIEFRSYSKTAGFTGVRCGYTVVPMALQGVNSKSEKVSLNALWRRRQTTKFNGASYIAQRGAAALYTSRGREETAATVAYYMDNARMLREAMLYLGLKAVGGVNAPYVWVKTPDGLSSWEFFDLLLSKCSIVGTPGVGFGPSGEGYFRFSAFSSHEATEEAAERLAKFIK
ncbi:MAG: LL-diaminopimelate aminotransferase [Bacteroidales bacterium]|nr:LL-diaminopimelate aminotransferase [Bacteroidales bacterium]